MVAAQETREKAKQILRLARQKLRDPKNWCQLHMAMRSDHTSCSARAPEAKRWCSVGAVDYAASLWEQHDHQAVGCAVMAMYDTAVALGYNGTSDLNDHYKTTHAFVIEFFGKAIIAVDGVNAQPKLAM